MARRLTSEAFVGREAERRELRAAFADAAGGRSALVLLGGESGVGKTRLLTESEREISAAGGLVLRGEAVEDHDGELPYALLTGALRPLVRAHHPVLSEIAPGSRSELSVLLPGLADRDSGPVRHDPGAQLRVFEALLELLELLSREQPLALILEDAHWADRTSRTFLLFLARSLCTERILLVVSYRTDELHRRHPLRPVLGELERLEHARRIELARLAPAELAELLTGILGEPPAEDLVARLHARSEGNPLHTEELYAAGMDGRGRAPQSLRDAFLLRIERLSPEAQRAARVLAVGRRLDEATIGAVSGIAPEALVPALREAVSEQVLVTGEDELLRFRHALLREALYEDLLPGERVELHLALARLIERDMRSDGEEAERAAAAAGHYAAAGDQPNALRTSVGAALLARSVHAYGEAADLAERALELWPRVPDARELASADRVELLRLAAFAQSMSGDRSRAETLLLQAVDEVDPAADPRRHASILSRLARTQWSLNRGVEGLETAQRALALLPPGEDSIERATLTAWLARTGVLRGRFREAIADGEAALAMATALGEHAIEGEVRNTLGMALVGAGQVEAGCAELRRAIEIARETGDLDDLGTAYSNLADILNIAGRTQEALAIAHEGLAAVPRRLMRTHDWMLLTLAEIAFDAGEWEMAAAHLADTQPRPVGVLLIFRLVRQAELALARGDEELAARSLAELEPMIASSSEPQWIGPFGALCGELRRRRHDLDGARAAVAQALDRIELCTEDVMRIARVSGVGVMVEADRAQRGRDLREPGETREAVERARLHVERLAAAALDGGPVEHAWREFGRAELARARGAADPRLWLTAAERWEAVERPYPAAVSRWRGAEAHVEAGNRDEAAALAAQALASARRLGAAWLAGEIDGLLQRARLSQPPAASNGALDSEPPAEDDPFGLTPRERQVLALIAEGATNRQIGKALYMAEKTASVHVSRILAKLGARTRTEAAAVAHRRRLT